MYKIIGADGKVYGPVSADQLRQWITDGRVNAQTQVQAEGQTEWKPLGSFPEFANVAGPAAAPIDGPATAQSVGGREAALNAVRGPAIGLKVTAILGLILAAVGLLTSILGVNIGSQQFHDPQMQEFFESLRGPMGIIQNLIGAAIGVVILIGASKLQSLQNYGFALTASILAMVPCISPCCLLGLPFGIWALVALNKPEVKSQFT